MISKLFEENIFNNECDNYMPIEQTMNTFVCNVCNRRYKYIRNLQYHQKYQCGKEPKFKCEICSRTFYHLGNMKRHVIVVHKSLSVLN